MIRYRLRLQPDVQYSFHAAPAPLSNEALEQLIEGAVVHEIQSAGFGYPAAVDLQLDQPPDEEALNAILVAIERCGYALIEGEVTQWVDGQAQGALVGFVGGAGCGVSTKNDGLTLILGVVGGLLGHFVGAQVRKHEVICRIKRAYRGAPAELVPVNDAKAPTITLSDWLAPVRA
jgi:hypothetical protein